MQNDKKPNWQLTIFGKKIHTPDKLLPMNHPKSPYKENKR